MINILKSVEIKNISGGSRCFCSGYTADFTDRFNLYMAKQSRASQMLGNLDKVTIDLSKNTFWLYAGESSTKVECIEQCNLVDAQSYCFLDGGLYFEDLI